MAIKKKEEKLSFLLEKIYDYNRQEYTFNLPKFYNGLF